MRKTLLFLAGADILAVLAILFFFLQGLGDGSVSSFNIGLWLALVLGSCFILAWGLYLRRQGRNGAACLVLALLAVPSLGIALMMALLLGLYAASPGSYR